MKAQNLDASQYAHCYFIVRFTSPLAWIIAVASSLMLLYLLFALLQSILRREVRINLLKHKPGHITPVLVDGSLMLSRKVKATVLVMVCEDLQDGILPHPLLIESYTPFCLLSPSTLASLVL